MTWDPEESDARDECPKCGCGLPTVPDGSSEVTVGLEIKRLQRRVRVPMSRCPVCGYEGLHASAVPLLVEQSEAAVNEGLKGLMREAFDAGVAAREAVDREFRVQPPQPLAEFAAAVVSGLGMSGLYLLLSWAAGRSVADSTHGEIAAGYTIAMAVFGTLTAGRTWLRGRRAGTRATEGVRRG